MDIHYIIGDATNPQGDGPRMLVHICNDIGGWGHGFVVALSKKWRQPEQQYRAWAGGELDLPFELGQVLFVQVEPQLWVANMIGQHGVGRRGSVPPIRYDAVRQGLARVAQQAQIEQASVHMPRIGAGLAGGEWSTISQIIQEELTNKGIRVTVYDLAP